MTNPMVPEKYRKVYQAPVILEKHVLVGTGSVILPGVVLGEGSSFGAMSLVNRSAEPWSVNVGIPCRKVKERSRELLKLEESMMKEIGRHE